MHKAIIKHATLESTRLLEIYFEFLSHQHVHTQYSELSKFFPSHSDPTSRESSMHCMYYAVPA